MTGIPELVKLSGEVAAYVELSSLRAELQLQMAVGLARAWSEKKSITLPEILDPSQHCHGHMWPTSLFRFNLYRTACRDNMKDDSNLSNPGYLKSAQKRHLIVIFVNQHCWFRKNTTKQIFLAFSGFRGCGLFLTIINFTSGHIWHTGGSGD